MPTRDEIRREIAGIVARIADVAEGEVTEAASLAALGVDSLRGLRIVAEVEKRYGVVVPEDKIGGIRSMRDVFALVDEQAPPGR